MLENVLSSGTIIIFIFTLCLGLALFNSMTRPPGSPPGPALLPFIGNVHLMLRRDTRNFFRELRQKYGDIYSVNIGYTHWIIINRFEILKELFVKNGELTSERPFLSSMLYNGEGIGLIPASGHLWERNRRFTLRKLRHFGFGSAKIGERMEIETKACLSLIENTHGQPFDIKRIILNGVSNLITSILFNIRSKDGDRSIEKITDIFDESATTRLGLLFAMFPCLRSIPWAQRKVETFGKQKAIIKPIYDNHVATFQDGVLRDFTDACLQELGVAKDGSTAKDKELQSIAIMRDLYEAGTETTTTALRWILIHLIRHPEVQGRIRTEIDDVVGKTRLPSLGDRCRMPYTEATIMEVLRLENIVPFSVMHEAKADLMFKGFRIPKSAVLFINLDSVTKDENVWKNPNEFNPSRFIDGDGSLTRKEEFIPFSLGRRICLGESLASSTLFLFLTTFLQRFHFLPAAEDQVPGLDCVQGEFIHRPLPFDLRAVLRND